MATESTEGRNPSNELFNVRVTTLPVSASEVDDYFKDTVGIELPRPGHCISVISANRLYVLQKQEDDTYAGTSTIVGGITLS